MMVKAYIVQFNSPSCTRGDAAVTPAKKLPGRCHWAVRGDASVAADVVAAAVLRWLCGVLVHLKTNTFEPYVHSRRGPVF